MVRKFYFREQKKGGLYTMNSDGSKMTFQTNRGLKPPVGTEEGEEVRLNYVIYMMNADGSNQT